MAWHNQGLASVAVGQTVVTITGGDLIAAEVGAGQAFQALQSGAALYDIVSVDSATQLTLSRPFLEESLVESGFNIAPVLGPNQNLEAALRSVLLAFNAAVDGPLAGAFETVLKVGVTDSEFFNLDETGLQLDVPVSGSALVSGYTDMTLDKILTAGWAGLAGNAKTLTASNDWDDELTFGIRFTSSSDLAANSPDTASYGGLVLPTSANDCLQLVFQVTASTASNIYFRSIVNAQKGKAWRTVTAT